MNSAIQSFLGDRRTVRVGNLAEVLYDGLTFGHVRLAEYVGRHVFVVPCLDPRGRISVDVSDERGRYIVTANVVTKTAHLQPHQIAGGAQSLLNKFMEQNGGDNDE